MKKIVLTMIVCAYVANAKTGVGFAHDMGFGVVAQTQGNINIHIGNNGMAGDYLFKNNQKIKEVNDLTWHLGVGAGIEWGGTFLGRVPVGLDWDFAKEWDLYVQLIPGLKLGATTGFNLGHAMGVRYFF